MQNFYGDGFANASFVDDPVVTKAYNDVQAALISGGEDAADKIHKELMKYVLEQAYQIPYPKAPAYRMWWPWLKNYSGERSLGYFWVNSWPQYTWIDQNLKASMGY